jgi:hypothetical protein
MAKIVAVHGIGQQFKGDAVIHKEWWPALQSGLHLAGGELTDPAELTCPFYGHLFRRKGTLGAGETFQPGDLAGDEIALLEQLWKSAASVEPERVPSRRARAWHGRLSSCSGRSTRCRNRNSSRTSRRIS